MLDELKRIVSSGDPYARYTLLETVGVGCVILWSCATTLQHVAERLALCGQLDLISPMKLSLSNEWPSRVSPKKKW